MIFQYGELVKLLLAQKFLYMLDMQLIKNLCAINRFILMSLIEIMLKTNMLLNTVVIIEYLKDGNTKNK